MFHVKHRTRTIPHVSRETPSAKEEGAALRQPLLLLFSLCQDLGETHVFRIELLLVRHSVMQIDGDDIAFMKAEDEIGKPRENRESRLLAKLTRLHAVDDGRRAAALDMTENRNARFDLRMLGDEFADFDGASSAFRYNDKDVALALLVRLLDLVADLRGRNPLPARGYTQRRRKCRSSTRASRNACP